METIVFRNDNNAIINIPRDEPNLRFFVGGVNKEIFFRLIHSYLINEKIISGNFIDLGAFVGDNTLPWAKNIDGTIYAFDPYIPHCEFIDKMAKLNGIDNIQTISYAISNKNEILTTDDDLFHCEFYKNGKRGKNVVNAVSLDYLFKEGVIKDVDYIHLDVEGMEEYVIEGAEHLIAEYRPIISFEQHLNTDNYQKLCLYFINIDYIVFIINEIIPPNKPDCRNFLAFPNEKYNKKIFKDINNKICHNILLTITKLDS